MKFGAVMRRRPSLLGKDKKMRPSPLTMVKNIY
jgi:hypothetical protein